MCNSATLVTSANTGIGKVSVANPYRDGSGTLVSVLTAAENGTTISSIIIKAVGDTTQGMVRLFIGDTGASVAITLFKEIPIPATTPTGIVPAFQTAFTSGFTLEPGYTLYASTQNAETFNVIAEGLDWEYECCS